jgi:predicted dehydrogenase
MIMTTRRTFIRNTSLAAGAYALNPTPYPLNPSDKIRVALIGCRNMGFGDLENAIKQPGVECVALCDVDDDILKKRAEEVGKRTGKVPATYKDFRRVMDDKTIDAVIIGTPDHWHCLPFLAACEAGKDIYVEKPLANSIAECDIMVQYARKYKRVVQVGQQQRSAPHWKDAMDIMRSGGIGDIRKVNVWANFNYGIGQPKKPDTTPPPGVDFNMWLGPAPERSFNPTRFHGSWRMFWDYGGGLLTDWGVHLLDMALWAKAIDTTPLVVTATGGNFAFQDHAHETFDTMDVSYQLKDYVINWSHIAGTQTGPYNRNYGLAFIGNLGTLVINREGWEMIPEKDGEKFKTQPLPPQPGKDSHEAHMKNFLECIKTRKDPNCTIENGRLVALYAHMGNIALKTGTALQWNEATKNFGNNAAANAMIRPVYRAPWELPKG